MPTRIGIKLKNKGFPWVYVPHGMLEPWSLSQKWYIKYPYFWLFEKKWSLQANLVRAVSQPEGINLQKIYPHVVYIPNGNKPPQNLPSKIWNVRPLNFLFLGRLHKKKGLIPLVKSWKLSKLNNDPNYQLIIAGPDDGLLHQLSNELKSSNNILYVGPVFGQAKEQLLKNSHFFLLPSYSEGFPTSVVEAMQYGLIPVISEGCNFPEVFANQLAFKAEPNINSIKNALELVVATQNIALIADKCQKFATEQFSIEHIADLQYQCYSSLL
jgi:glycosyltransferase involved in cell wall biosynthesis